MKHYYIVCYEAANTSIRRTLVYGSRKDIFDLYRAQIISLTRISKKEFYFLKSNF